MFETVRARPANSFLHGNVPLTLPLLARTFLLPAPPASSAFHAAFTSHLADGPWQASFANAPGETARVVQQALRAVMMATSTLRPDDVRLEGLDPESRVAQHLSALKQLWLNLEGTLPDDLTLLRQIIDARAEDVIEPLHVIHDPQDPNLCALENSVLEKVTLLCGLPDDIAAQRVALRARYEHCAAPAHTALGHVQRHLLTGAAASVAQDDSIRLFGVRDAEMEAHIAASLALRLLDEDTGLSPAQIGLLLPAGGPYVALVEEAFTRAGLPLSGLPSGADRRDLAGELLLYLLLALRKPAAAMVIAALARSALMPWRVEDGVLMSDDIMAGTWPPGKGLTLEGRSRLMADLLVQRPTRPHYLAENLQQACDGLTQDPTLAEEVARFRDMVEPLIATLRASPPKSEIRWDDLLARVPLAASQNAEPGPIVRHGIRVLEDGATLSHPVRHLLVLGFSDGAFPQPPGLSPVFLDSELAHIHQHCGLHLLSRQDVLMRRLKRFQLQLMAASHSVSMFVPFRDMAGKRTAPAASLGLIARCLGESEDPDKLIVDTDSLDDERVLPRAPECKSVPMPALQVPPVLAFGQDLMTLRKRSDGITPAAQSPSRLDNLLVSPLAWLLNEINIQDKSWAPEGLDAMIIGSLFHHVAEHLFLPAHPLPDDDEIATRVPELLDEGIRQIAPFLQSGTWLVERQRMARDFTSAAQTWRATLQTLNAEIIANEVPLQGEALGMACRGNADSILRLPDGSLIIVDHKTSGAKTRRQRMKSGWDLQVGLYRTLMGDMLKQASRKGETEVMAPEIKSLFADLQSAGKGWGKKGAQLGVAYHTTRDHTLLLHGLAPSTLSPTTELIEADIGVAALARLEGEIAALRRGELRLPDEGQLEIMRKGGVAHYALEASPLAATFILPVPEEDA